IREGREATFFFPREGVWTGVDIRAIGDVYAIQELLGEFRPDKTPSLIPGEITAAGKVPICFTAATADHSASAVQIASASTDALIICALSSGLQSISTNMWTISDEFEFKKQK
ncbi:MAG: hypothetical protein IJ723_07025, partial [Ruminococcus sp.]|nr:hypothetical protein [Ruminococcus sp.]